MSAPERVKVGGHIPALVRVAMHSTEASGGEHTDTRTGGEVNGRGHGGSPMTTPRGERRQIAYPALDHSLSRGDQLERFLVEPDPGVAGHNGDRRR